jgi:ABC-type antimicrobial peptide transport system permease subunit
MKYIQLILVLVFFGAIGLKAQDNISPERKAAIDSLALEKVRDLSKYISIIGDKATPYSEATRVIERTLELFMDGAEMGVSSLNRKKVNYYPIKKYLERLMRLNYQTVNITWFNIQYVSDLVKQPDGRYVGVITIYQKFEGVTKEGLKYVDTTKKDITIYVERKQTQIDGIPVGFWDVLLGDIRVKETTK